MRRLLFALSIVFWLVGCSSDGPVVFAPTTSESVEGVLRFTHPSNAFSIELPRSWSVYSQHTDTLAAASFTPPDFNAPVLQVSLIRLQPELQAQDINTLLDVYQREIRPDARRYTPGITEVMGDGSWRLTGFVAMSTDTVQQINTFVDRREAFMSVLDVALVDDANIQRVLERAVNTLEIHVADDTLQATSLLSLTSDTSGPYAIVNVATWLTPEGIFFITGEVANYSDQTVSSVPIRVELQSDDGTPIVEAFDTTMGYMVPPGGFAPFSLRFGQGQPEMAARYRLTLGNDAWRDQPAPSAGVVGADSLEWTSEQAFTPEGYMLINGTVTNTSNEDVHEPLVTITVFDDQQQVIAAGFVFVEEDVLEPGQSVEYRLRVSEMGGEPVNYIVEAQGVERQ